MSTVPPSLRTLVKGGATVCPHSQQHPPHRYADSSRGTPLRTAELHHYPPLALHIPSFRREEKKNSRRLQDSSKLLKWMCFVLPSLSPGKHESPRELCYLFFRPKVLQGFDFTGAPSYRSVSLFDTHWFSLPFSRMWETKLPKAGRSCWNRVPGFLPRISCTKISMNTRGPMFSKRITPTPPCVENTNTAPQEKPLTASEHQT